MLREEGVGLEGRGGVGAGVDERCPMPVSKPVASYVPYVVKSPYWASWVPYDA